MHPSSLKALGFSLGLHLVMAGLLAALRAEMPTSPSLVEVEWVDLAPSMGADQLSASPNQGRAGRPSAKLAAPAESGQASPASAAFAAGESIAEAQARRMSAEEFYRASVRQTLERKKIYPPLARRLGQTGTVVLKFVIGKDGSLLGSEIAEASPYPVLNEAARNLLISSRFEPIPAELERLNWEFTIPVEYRLDQRLTKSL